MASNNLTPPKTPRPTSIPLQDLSRPPDTATSYGRPLLERGESSRNTRSSEKRSSRLLGHNTNEPKYQRLPQASPNRNPRTLATQNTSGRSSPVDDLSPFAAATGGLGLSFGNGRMSS